MIPLHKHHHRHPHTAMLLRLAALLVLPSLSISQYVMPNFGGGCGGCPMPSCAPPRPICPPQICPPPQPCPPQFCPPPPICPPPPPPVVCPPPPPPPPCGCQSRPVYYPVPTYTGGCGAAPVPALPAIPAQNDCCCGCSSPCRYRGRARKAAGVKTVDPSCNNEELRKIITENIQSEDASESKRLIQTKSEQILGHMVNVVCGRGEFSYIAHTETFCQATREDITCYAFKPL